MKVRTRKVKDSDESHTRSAHCENGQIIRRRLSPNFERNAELTHWKPVVCKLCCSTHLHVQKFPGITFLSNNITTSTTAISTLESKETVFYFYYYFQSFLAVYSVYLYLTEEGHRRLYSATTL